MQLQQIPFYYPINTQGIIQATATSAQSVGPPQSIMIPSTNSSAGPGTSAPPPIYYPGVYTGIIETIYYFFVFLNKIFICIMNL